jgi:hypothetical protein
MTAAIKPNKRPIKESWYEARYLNAIKYPLIEQARISRERISKKHPSFLNYLSRQIFKEHRLCRQRKKALEKTVHQVPITNRLVEMRISPQPLEKALIQDK